MKKPFVDLKSKNFLYIVFFIVIFNLGHFIMNKDSQSLFLFICISVIVYMFQKNMIIVLVYPLLIVNGLIILKKLIGTNGEGFEYSIGETKESLKEKVFMIKWIQKNIPNLDNDEEKEVEENKYSKYSQFDVSIDEDSGLIPFQRIINDIFMVEVKSKEMNITPINNFVNYINYISQITRYDDKSIYKDEIDFVNDLFQDMTNDYYGNEKNEKNNDNENENLDEENEVEMINEQDDDEIVVEEETDDELTGEYEIIDDETNETDNEEEDDTMNF